MAKEKMTKRDYFNQLLALDLTDEQKAFIEHELALLDKKNSAVKKPTANQTANVGIKAEVLALMEGAKLYTITELVKAYGKDITNQKMSALVRQMVGEGSVERVEDKRKAYFRLADTDTAENGDVDEE